MTLRTRIAIVTAAAVAVVVVVGAVFIIHGVVRDALMTEIDESLLERATPIQAISLARRDVNLPIPFVAVTPNAIQGRAVRGFDAFFVQLVTADGTTHMPPDQPVTLPVTARDLVVAGVRQTSSSAPSPPPTIGSAWWSSRGGVTANASPGFQEGGRRARSLDVRSRR